MKVLDIIAGGLLVFLGFPVVCYGVLFNQLFIIASGAAGVVVGFYIIAKAIEEYYDPN